MSNYPEGRFVAEFARRTRENLENLLEDKPVNYKDSALICYLLAVFVLPHERAQQPDLLGATLGPRHRYDASEVIEVIRVSDRQPEELRGKDVARLIRNAIAHMNIKPVSEDGETLTHLLVWNRRSLRNNPKGEITFVAKINLAKLRPLALEILNELARSNATDRDFGLDPIGDFDRRKP